MVSWRLDRMVANAVRSVTNGIQVYSATKVGERRDGKVRDAYLEMYSGPPTLQCENKEFFEGGSDISFITDAFPNLVRSEGCKVPERIIPWSNRYTDKVAFRAELRRGEDDREDKYIAILWSSYKNHANSFRLEYKTNDLSFVDQRRIG